MENNIPTLYIFELDSFVVKSAKMSTILCPFEPCCHDSHDASKVSLRSVLK